MVQFYIQFCTKLLEGKLCFHMYDVEAMRPCKTLYLKWKHMDYALARIYLDTLISVVCGINPFFHSFIKIIIFLEHTVE